MWYVARGAEKRAVKIIKMSRGIIPVMPTSRKPPVPVQAARKPISHARGSGLRAANEPTVSAREMAQANAKSVGHEIDPPLESYRRNSQPERVPVTDPYLLRERNNSIPNTRTDQYSDYSRGSEYSQRDRQPSNPIQPPPRPHVNQPSEQGVDKRSKQQVKPKFLVSVIDVLFAWFLRNMPLR
jgi:hypothetical protein